MSNFFARSGRGAVQNYHSYIVDDAVLQNIGLASYTRNSIENFGIEKSKTGEKILSKDITEYFDGDVPKDKLLGDGEDLQIMAYDNVAKDYYLKSTSGGGESNLWYTPSGSAASDIKEFQERFDKIQKGLPHGLSSEVVFAVNFLWSQIQTSSSGCITFDIDYSVLDCNRNTSIRLYFNAGAKVNTSRGVAHNGASFNIADVPRTAAGLPFSYSESKKLGTGQYALPAEGGAKNPGNTVAGKLRTSWNDALGQWEAGTQQMLVRLISDIDGVSLKDLPSNIDDASQYYTGALFLGECKRGSGIPFSVEDSNPNLFGPNIIGCGEKAKVEKIIVTNRTPRSYTKGEIVICSLMGTDWIPMGFGLPKTVTKKFESKLSDIQKYIVQANSFFRDSTDQTQVDFGPITLSLVNYAESVRHKFYRALSGTVNPYFATQIALTSAASGANDLNKIAALNMLNIDPESAKIDDNGAVVVDTDFNKVSNFQKNISFLPSTGYLPVYDADVIPTSIGGNNTNHAQKPYSVLTQTNYSQIPYDEPEFNDHFSVNSRNSWGIYYSDGYTSSSVGRLKNYVDAYTSAGKIPNSFIYTGGDKLDFTAEGQASDPLAEGVSLFQVFDSNLFHLPAQIALNASGNPSLYMPKLWQIDYSKDINYAGSMIDYLKSSPGQKGEWIQDSSGKDLFNLTPVNPNKIQFTALSLNLALCSFQSTGSANGNFSDLSNTLYYPFSNNERHLFLGNLWKRINVQEQKTLYSENGVNITSRIGFNRYLIDYKTGSIVEPARKDKPDDGPGIFPKWFDPDFTEERSNVVGILAAKQTISLPNGGQLSLITNNHYGYNGYGVVSGGGNNGPDITIIGGMSWSTDTGGTSKTLENVQWGSSGDDNRYDSFGTVGLWAKVYDHCPNTIYDGRYFTPLHFNSNSSKLDFSQPSLSVGTVITPTTKVEYVKNPIRRNMLLTGGGFTYIQRYLGGYEGADINIEKAGGGYAIGDTVTFAGQVIYEVETVGSNGEITKLKLKEAGEFPSNPFSNFPKGLKGSISRTDGVIAAEIYLKSLKIREKVKKDEEPVLYKQQLLSVKDNNGNGDGDGYVRTSKTTSVALSNNISANTDIGGGKYDIFLFFVNDILCSTENGNGGTYLPFDPYVQYLNLEISAN
jgi:hypothetical protein